MQTARLGADDNVWLMNSVLKQAAENEEEPGGAGNLTEHNHLNIIITENQNRRHQTCFEPSDPDMPASCMEITGAL